MTGRAASGRGSRGAKEEVPGRPAKMSPMETRPAGAPGPRGRPGRKWEGAERRGSASESPEAPGRKVQRPGRGGGSEVTQRRHRNV